MAETSILIKNGAIDVIRWNSDIKLYQNKPIENEKFPWFYDDIVEFANDLTVEGFMNAFEPFFEVIDTHFVAYTRGFKIREYYKQMLQPVSPEESDEISHVEIYWGCDITEYEDLSAGKTDVDLELFGSFHGIGKIDECNYGLSMSPLNEWKHYQIKLNPTINCTKFQKYPDKSAEIITVFKADKKFRLYDVLRYFFFELTWYGYPSDAKKFADHLIQISDDIESGKEKLVELDLEEMQIEHLQVELKEAIENDNFEGASRIRDRIALLRENKEKS